MKTRIFLALLCVFTLSGCVSREQADAQLAKGCEAGVKALLPEGYSLASVKNTRFSPSPEGVGYRHVELDAVELDGWLETEKTYNCIFVEQFGFLKTSYTASIYQVSTGQEVFGKAGHVLNGDAEDFIKLEDAVRKAMYGL
jgi:hypothetical protein